MLRFENGVDPRQRGPGHSVEHHALFVRLGIIDDDFEHKAVHLRFGQRVSPLLLDRVLGGQYGEQRVHLVGGIADGDLALLHRFEQGALNFGRGAVDLVGQD